MNPMKLFIGILLIGILSAGDGRCDTALASYYVWPGTNLTFVSRITGTQIPTILSYNPQIPNQYSIQVGDRVNVPFPCECLDGDILGHVFTFTTLSGVTYDLIAKTYYSNLTTTESLQRDNTYPATNIPDTNAAVNVSVNCSCGDSSVSKDYGLFVTYPLREGETLESVARTSNVTTDLLTRYNLTSNFRGCLVC